jgi:hypothetical protein
MSAHRIAAALLVASAIIATPAAAQTASGTQGLASCAGAVAAVGDIDVLIYPRGARGEWAAVLGRILEGLNRQEGLEGMTGRYAASAARSFWEEQPNAELEAAANACRERYAR